MTGPHFLTSVTYDEHYNANVLDLAVAVVMGAAFGAVVTALVKDLITPLIAAIRRAR